MFFVLQISVSKISFVAMTRPVYLCYYHWIVVTNNVVTISYSVVKGLKHTHLEFFFSHVHI